MTEFHEPDRNALVPHSRRNPRRAYDERGREIEPMTLQDAMGCGVNALRVICGCGHEAEIPLAMGRWPSKSFVPDAGMTLRCSGCGQWDPKTIPVWPQRRREAYMPSVASLTGVDTLLPRSSGEKLTHSP